MKEWTGSFFKDNLISQSSFFRNSFFLVNFWLFHLTTLFHVIKKKKKERKEKKNTHLPVLFCHFPGRYTECLVKLCYNNNNNITRSWYESTILWEESIVFQITVKVWLKVFSWENDSFFSIHLPYDIKYWIYNCIIQISMWLWIRNNPRVHKFCTSFPKF